uniref:Protein CWC15 n=1 Tax=Tetraselmis sp. GSL018 TaxID=582737 RepID=A0A061R6A3_9CHLO|eukprot:CAMPEP_0177601964 /NCGR_PEP_ID=MMETSP0419_2-20121207/14588_1 /TAXON_ID=582737 /ORGANISM="Tetraselmis sp., Strain GSL018" /LENGTH=220 /DNA_ID=CAMNT_0019095361 /DNA_START=220 /DNA_END=882 /DNA_ORIENTATION=+
MTTAHRPTWAPALGGEEQGGSRIFVPSTAQSAKDQRAHTKLKFRKSGQGARVDIAERDLKAELEANEAKHFRERFNFEEDKKEDLRLLEASGESTGRPKMLVPKAVDADDIADEEPSDDEEEESDDEAELIAELERIKKERAEEAARQAAEAAEKQQKEKEEELRHGNPLLHAGESNFGVKRRWDDDVVFKNQARGEPKPAKRFVNDTIRSDFHRRFLAR